jgi:hypothetical protein
MILVERRRTGHVAAGVIERIDRSARRRAGVKCAARGARRRSVEATGSQRGRNLESQEEDNRSTASHGQQRRVRDAFLAEGRALAGRQLLFGPAGCMAEFMQQRRRLRENERNQREADEPMSATRTQDSTLRSVGRNTSGNTGVPLSPPHRPLSPPCL